MNKNIRNFCVIAHIDHGKSSLSDCILRATSFSSTKSTSNTQIFDDMELEIERGITIKSHPVQMEYYYKNIKYILNLIDTPGHVDFSYEVYRSISVCEGALLIIDASQGIQAQTISNLELALKYNLKIIPIINKIDIPNIDTDSIVNDIMSLLNCRNEDIIMTSAKENTGIDKLLESIILHIPSPNGNVNSSLQLQIFDLSYNTFKGVEVYFRVWDGCINNASKLRSMLTSKVYQVLDTGVIRFTKSPKSYISCGNIGYMILGVKDVKQIHIGDTLVNIDDTPDKLIKKPFKAIQPMVFVGVFPVSRDDYMHLKASIYKLNLSDSSFSFEEESSISLGFGFRCGFLGILHIDIFKERLKREYQVDVLITTPNVSYYVFLKTNKDAPILIHNPSNYPNFANVYQVKEPYIQARIITMVHYIGMVISLCIKKRGRLIDQYYMINNRVKLIFELPLSEIVYNFYTDLKTITKGYSSFDYKSTEFKVANVVKLDIYVNYKIVDAFSMLIDKSNAFDIGKKICLKLKSIIPKHQFELPIQACIGNKIIARENIKSFRKNVTAKCYGGDISRKRKLLEKQKQGKKKMRKIGSVNIPENTFISILNN
jgi:GTP-binding protein LepA